MHRRREGRSSAPLIRKSSESGSVPSTVRCTHGFDKHAFYAFWFGKPNRNEGTTAGAPGPRRAPDSFEFCSGPGKPESIFNRRVPRRPARSAARRRPAGTARPRRAGARGAGSPGRTPPPRTAPRFLIFTGTRHRTSLHNFQLTLHTDSGRALPFRYGLWSNRHDAPLSGHDLCLGTVR